MHEHVMELLKPEARTRLAGRPEVDLLRVPLDDLDALTPESRKRLRQEHRAEVLGDLLHVELRDARLAISSHIIDILSCFLFYPYHDPGPPCSWEGLFRQAPLAHYEAWPGSPFHTRFGPVFYRGRLDGTAKALVVGQDPASDETLAGRAFVGMAGQLAQTFLAKLGLTRSYLMFNTFLFGVQSGNITDALALDPVIKGYRNQLFDTAKAGNPISLIVSFGQWARKSVENWPGRGAIPFVSLTHPTAPSGVASDWNADLATAIASVTPDFDGTADPTPFTNGASLPQTDIPRRDLPFGVPPWHGTGGTRSQRPSGAFETQILWTAP